MKEGRKEGKNEIRKDEKEGFRLMCDDMKVLRRIQGWIYDSQSVKIRLTTINQRIREYQQKRNSLRIDSHTNS